MDIVVLGGTFAPPTLAHMALMRAGMAFTGAQLGIWAPSSLSYMRLWRPDRLPEPPFGSDAFREGALRALLSGEADMRPYFGEMYREGGAYTYDTLCELRKEYGGRLSFLMGDDLISGLPRWHRADELVREFDIIVVSRSRDAEIALDKAGVTGARIMPFTDEYSDMSASLVRRLFLSGKNESARRMLAESVYSYIENQMSDS